MWPIRKCLLLEKTHTDKKEGVGKDHRANINQKGTGIIIIVQIKWTLKLYLKR